MFAHPFMTHAFVAGTAVAVAAGLGGYFLVLRAQMFTADALSHVAFTGAFAALAIGVDPRVGLFTVTVLVALGMGTLGRRARPDDVAIGGVFAWVLGLGVYFLSVYTSRRSAGANGTSGVSVLFGSIFGLTASRAAWTAVVALSAAAAVVAIARPLLFASLDEHVAAARGVPVRALGYAFLVLVAVITAESAQVVGALLILGLLAAPAGAATRLTTRPIRAMWLSSAIAVASIWAGLTVSYLVPTVPPSFGILAVATTIYLAAIVATRERPAAA